MDSIFVTCTWEIHVLFVRGEIHVLFVRPLSVILLVCLSGSSFVFAGVLVGLVF